MFPLTVQFNALATLGVRDRRWFGHCQVSLRSIGQLNGNLCGGWQPWRTTRPGKQLCSQCQKHLATHTKKRLLSINSTKSCHILRKHLMRLFFLLCLSHTHSLSLSLSHTVLGHKCGIHEGGYCDLSHGFV